MRRAIHVLATLLVCTTFAGVAAANAGYYNEIQTHMKTSGCPTDDTGCQTLCHGGGDPNNGGSIPPADEKAFLKVILQYGWTFPQAATTLDPFLDQFANDPSNAKAVADIVNGCQDPTADIGTAITVVPDTGPVYGCSTSRIGADTGAAGFVAGALGLAMAFSLRRKRS